MSPQNYHGHPNGNLVSGGMYFSGVFNDLLRDVVGQYEAPGDGSLVHVPPH